MKKFLRYLLLIVLPFMAAAIASLWYPLPRRWAYNYAAKDCRGAVWIQHRLYEDERPVDVAFIGSSRTFCAVDDEQLDSLLRPRQLQVANLALCRFGRDGQYAVLRDLLITKKPQWVVIEVTERESFSSHLSYPALAQPGEVVNPVSWLNRDYFKVAGNHLAVKHRYLQEQIFGTYQDTVPDPQQGLFYHITGYEAIPGNKVAEYDTKKMPAGTPGGAVRKRADWEYATSKAWLKKMTDLCKQNHVKVAFLFLPNYTNAASSPAELEYYSTLAPVWMVPTAFTSSSGQWRDVDHLNCGGTELVTTWLSGRFPSP